MYNIHHTPRFQALVHFYFFFLLFEDILRGDIHIPTYLTASDRLGLTSHFTPLFLQNYAC